MRLSLAQEGISDLITPEPHPAASRTLTPVLHFPSRRRRLRQARVALSAVTTATCDRAEVALELIAPCDSGRYRRRSPRQHADQPDQ